MSEPLRPSRPRRLVYVASEADVARMRALIREHIELHHAIVAELVRAGVCVERAHEMACSAFEAEAN